MHVVTVAGVVATLALASLGASAREAQDIHAASSPAAIATPVGTPSAAHAMHWDYQGPGGPTHWGDLDEDYATCSLGHAQSPVDIQRTVKKVMPPLMFEYTMIAPTMVNNGHTIQVNVPPGNSVTVGERRWNLVQFHFHTPSEESIGDRRHEMVAHFVHKDADGKLGVVALLIDAGKSDNAAWDTIFAQISKAGATPQPTGHFFLPALLPQDHGYYALKGSLTTPPCAEGVSWMILKHPVTLKERDIAAFRQMFPLNARPVQSLAGRTVYESL